MRRIAVAFFALSGVMLGAAPAAAQLFASVLPASRAVVVNTTATAFATMINAGSSALSGCRIALPSGTSANFSFQTTNPATNAPTGTPNAAVSIAAGAAQTFFFAITPTATFTERNIALVFSCTGATVTPIVGVNTFLLTSSSTATPDIVALSATISNDGIARTPGTNAAGAFSVATINVGAAGTVAASVDTGGVSVSAGFTICQTNSQAQCLSAPAASVNATFSSNQAGTFSIFMSANGLVTLDPAVRRAFVRFRAGGITVGATSVAIETQTTLAGEGGSLQLGNVNINAPGLAVVSPTNFTASTASAPAAPPNGFRSLNSTYNITLTNSAGAPNSGLNGPVLVTLPYGGLGVSDPTMLGVLHYDNAAGRYEHTTIQSVNTTNQTVTFDSRRFSQFLIVLADPTIFPTPAPFSIQSFRPNRSGFQINNIRPNPLSDGTCMGMASFAVWFWNFRPGEQLYGKYSTAFTPASVVDLLVTRAQIMQSVYARVSGYPTTNATNFQYANQGAVQLLLRKYLSQFGRPVHMDLQTDLGNGDGHAIVVYGYTATHFQAYDPNHQGQEVLIPYSPNSIGPYTTGGKTYNKFAIIGAPSYGDPDNFAALAAQADAGFTNSADITVTSPTQGSTVNRRDVDLIGSLSGTLNAASQAYFWSNASPSFRQLSLASRSFNQKIDVKSQENVVVVIAGVPAFSSNLSNTLRNAATKIVKFNGPAAAKFRVTMQWNEGNSDVDLYVTEPLGATAWYASKTTAAGLRLDFDNTTGAGIENTTLEASGTAQTGTYKIGVHYFSDKGTPKTVTGSVDITTNEGSDTGAFEYKNFSIRTANSSNAQPGSTGPDWVNIGTADVINNVIVKAP